MLAALGQWPVAMGLSLDGPGGLRMAKQQQLAHCASVAGTGRLKNNTPASWLAGVGRSRSAGFSRSDAAPVPVAVETLELAGVRAGPLEGIVLGGAGLHPPLLA